MRNLLERRWRMSWCWLVFAAIISVYAAEGIFSDKVSIPSKGSSRSSISKKDRPGDFAFVLGCHLVTVATGVTFTFYQFRRGSWFNPKY